MYLPRLVRFHHGLFSFLLISSVPRQTASAFLAQYGNDLLLNLERGIPSESELMERYENTVVPLMRTSRVYGFPQRWRYVA
tara:strand:- start:3139 stop:3381 length:243 start_codon:yes stop_codon:yes gene_type:complete